MIVIEMFCNIYKLVVGFVVGFLDIIIGLGFIF